MKKSFIAGITFLGIGLVAGGSYIYWTSTPTYALHQAFSSFQEKDKAKFDNFVDADNVIESGVDSILAIALKETTSKSESGMEALGSALGAKMVEAFKPQIKTMLKEEIYKSFKENASTEASSKNQEKLKKMKGLGDIIASSKNKTITFKSLGDVNQSGNTAFIPVNLHHHVYKKDFTLEIKLGKGEGHWRLKELSNIGSFVSLVDEWKQEYLKNVNAPIRKELESSLVVSKFAKKNKPSSQWDFNKVTAMGIKIKNNGNMPISRFEGEVSVLNKQGNTIYSFTVLNDKKLAPGEVYTGFIEKKINQFSRPELELHKTPNENLNAKLRLDSLTYSDGRVVKIQTEVGSRLPASVN